MQTQYGEWCWFTTVYRGRETRVICPDRADAKWFKELLREHSYQVSATEDGVVARSPAEVMRAEELRQSVQGAMSTPGAID